MFPIFNVILIENCNQADYFILYICPVFNKQIEKYKKKIIIFLCIVCGKAYYRILNINRTVH